VFDDAPGSELRGTFARIVARYQAENGRETEMQEYLYSNLGISHEAQDSARAILSGEVVTAPTAPPPPPAQLHKSVTPETDTDQAQSIANSLLKHQTQIQGKATSLVSTFTTTRSRPTGNRASVNLSQSTSPITPNRKRGNWRVRRRSSEGFSFLEDGKESAWLKIVVMMVVATIFSAN
jgi:hypothetical protein